MHVTRSLGWILALLLCFGVLWVACGGGDGGSASRGGGDDDDDLVSGDDDDDDNDSDDDDDDSDDDDDDDDDDDRDHYAPPPSDEIGIFVAERGDNDDPGTMAKPVRTIKKGLSLAEDQGKVVFVAEGLYQEQLTASVSLFGGYHPDTWVRDPNEYESTIEYEGETLDIEWEEKSQEEAIIVEGFTIVALSNHPLNDVVEIVETATILAYNKIAGGNVSITLETVAEETLVEGNEIQSPETGIRVEGGVVTIRKNELYVSGILQVDPEGIRLVGADDVTIVDNKIELAYGKTTKGIWVTGGTARIQGNEIYAGMPQYSATGIYIYSGTVLVEGNNIEGGDWSPEPAGSLSTLGVMIYGDSVVLNGNRIFGGRGSTAAAVEQNMYAEGAVLVNNVIDGGRAVNGGWSTAVEVTDAILINNTIYGGNSEGGSIGVNLENGYYGEVIALINNIVDGGDSPKAYGVTVPTSSFCDREFYNNDFWGADQTCSLYVPANFDCYDDPSEINGCGWPTCTAAQGNLSKNPRLTGDKHLESDSPCIDAGADPWSLSYGMDEAGEDIDGDARPYNNVWDVGADEYVSK